METRKNTLKLAFAQGAKMPIHLDVLRFMMRVLKVPATDVHSVYKDENDQRFYIKFIDENSFNRFSGTMEEQYWFQYADGEKAKVQLEMASRQFKYIRIFNLPPETEDKDIAAVLGQFGRIRQHVRERYPSDFGYPVFSGVRGVHMEIEKEIPANMYIGHFRARLYYDGLKNRCFFCKAEGHNKSDCPKLADSREAGPSSSVNSRLYSQVAANMRIATGPSGSVGTIPTSMTVLKVPQHPSAGDEGAAATGEETTAAAVGEKNPQESVNSRTNETATDQMPSSQQASTTTNDQIAEKESVETGGTSSARKEESGLKRPPLFTSENDSSDMDTGSKRGRGKKKKTQMEKPGDRSRSNSRRGSRSNSRRSK